MAQCKKSAELYCAPGRSVWLSSWMTLVPLRMWSLLQNLQFTGNVVAGLGNFGGHLLGEKRRDFPRGDFMYELCNGVYLELMRYRRGDDFEHYSCRSTPSTESSSTSLRT